MMNFGVLLFHWQMAQSFAVQNLNFEKKGVHPFYLSDSLKSQPLVIFIIFIEVAEEGISNVESSA